MKARSEYSSCPEGHYDSFCTNGGTLYFSKIGILLLPGRALRRDLCDESDVTHLIGILLLPGRALRRNAASIARRP